MKDNIFIRDTIRTYVNESFRNVILWYPCNSPPLPPSTPKLQPFSILTSLVSFLKALSVAALSKGLFWFLPNIFGKYSGRSLPRQRLASVIVRGPPERILK